MIAFSFTSYELPFADRLFHPDWLLMFRVMKRGGDDRQIRVFG
jgi:hypothetical protein